MQIMQPLTWARQLGSPPFSGAPHITLPSKFCFFFNIFFGPPFPSAHLSCPPPKYIHAWKSICLSSEEATMALSETVDYIPTGLACVWEAKISVPSLRSALALALLNLERTLQSSQEENLLASRADCQGGGVARGSISRGRIRRARQCYLCNCLQCQGGHINAEAPALGCRWHP